MDSPFEFILGDYLKRATENLNGTVVVESKGMFSTILADAGFNFTTNAVDEIKSYLAGRGYPDIERVYVFTSLTSNLKRKSSRMKTEEKLYLVKTASGSLNALYFTGCDIDDS